MFNKFIILFFIKRMSLAMYASPIDYDNIQVNADNDQIARKRQANNRTQKRVPKENNYSEKVNSVLQTIHNSQELISSGGSAGLSDFNPMPPPTSVGVEQTRIREDTSRYEEELNNSNTINNSNSNSNNYEQPELKQLHNIDYKRFMPNYDNYKTSSNTSNIPNVPYSSGYSHQPVMNENNILLEKLNYMIHLLEEQQDEKTNNVTEELVLYCFLGIFIIFIADSFVRVGKYVR